MDLFHTQSATADPFDFAQDDQQALLDIPGIAVHDVYGYSRPMTLLWIALGGAIGAVGRFSVASLVSERVSFSPLGTFAVNISGAFALGLFTGIADQHFDFSPEVSYLLATGVLGSYTTFSTLFYETFRLFEDGRNRVALLYAAGSQLLGVLVVIAALGIVRLW